MRYALCVGINDYPGNGADLSGCVNDAHDWTSLLASKGYAVTQLIDSAATKANIVSNLRAVVDNLKYRERFVFTFSGHGTWVPDLDGDEIDGRDEALCCYDYPTGGLLLDDELHEIFKRARHGTQVTVLSDSCHSGTVARGLIANPMETEERKPRFLSPGLLPTVPVSVDQAIEAERSFVRATSRTGPVLISGCDDPEYSYDAWFNGRPNGAFTRAAIDSFVQSSPTTMKEWYRQIRLRLPNPAYPQTPKFGATMFQSFRTPLS